MNFHRVSRVSSFNRRLLEQQVGSNECFSVASSDSVTSNSSIAVKSAGKLWLCQTAGVAFSFVRESCRYYGPALYSVTDAPRPRIMSGYRGMRLCVFYDFSFSLQTERTRYSFLKKLYWLMFKVPWQLCTIHHMQPYRSIKSAFSPNVND